MTMSAIQELINRCEMDAETLAMHTLKRQVDEAVKELATLRAERDRLREALKVIVEDVDVHNKIEPGMNFKIWVNSDDIRAAKEALKGKQ